MSLENGTLKWFYNRIFKQQLNCYPGLFSPLLYAPFLCVSVCVCVCVCVWQSSALITHLLYSTMSGSQMSCEGTWRCLTPP